jgi:hypothetical protein
MTSRLPVGTLPDRQPVLPFRRLVLHEDSLLAGELLELLLDSLESLREVVSGSGCSLSAMTSGIFRQDIRRSTRKVSSVRSSGSSRSRGARTGSLRPSSGRRPSWSAPTEPARRAQSFAWVAPSAGMRLGGAAGRRAKQACTPRCETSNVFESQASRSCSGHNKRRRGTITRGAWRYRSEPPELIL